MFIQIKWTDLSGPGSPDLHFLIYIVHLILLVVQYTPQQLHATTVSAVSEKSRPSTV